MSRLAIGALCAWALLLTPALSAAQVIPNEADLREAVNHYRTGQKWLVAERWERAITEFRAAARLYPLFTDAQYGLGQANMALQRYTSAILAFQECLASARAIHGLRDRARFEADRRILDEVSEIRDAIRRRSDADVRARRLDEYAATLLRGRSILGQPFEPPAPVLLALGSAHFHNGDRGRAEYYWMEATRVDDALGEAWNNLAVVYASSGRGLEAADAIRKAERARFRVNPKLKETIAAITVQ
jgi:tetratricopeptide (TPR) repeat protein